MVNSKLRLFGSFWQTEYMSVSGGHDCPFTQSGGDGDGDGDGENG